MAVFTKTLPVASAVCFSKSTKVATARSYASIISVPSCRLVSAARLGNSPSALLTPLTVVEDFGPGFAILLLLCGIGTVVTLRQHSSHRRPVLTQPRPLWL